MLCSPKALTHQETMISKIWFICFICFADFWVLFGTYVRRVCPRKINFLEFILKCFTKSHLWFEPKLLLEALHGSAIYNPSQDPAVLTLNKSRLWNNTILHEVSLSIKDIRNNTSNAIENYSKILALKTENGLDNKMAFYKPHLWWTIQTSDLHRLSGTFCSWPLQT